MRVWPNSCTYDCMHNTSAIYISLAPLRVDVVHEEHDVLHVDEPVAVHVADLAAALAFRQAVRLVVFVIARLPLKKKKEEGSVCVREILFEL